MADVALRRNSSSLGRGVSRDPRPYLSGRRRHLGLASGKQRVRPTIDEFLDRATPELRGALEELIDVARGGGLNLRSYEHSVMATPPENRSRMLFTFWISSPWSGNQMWSSAATYAEYFNVPEERAIELLGPDGPKMSLTPAAAFASTRWDFVRSSARR